MSVNLDRIDSVRPAAARPQFARAESWAADNLVITPRLGQDSGAAPSPAAKASASIPIATTKGDNLAPQNTVELSWGDVIDMVNPIQQLPIVGDIYRSITGEKINGVARVLGGFLYGGLSGGFVAALTAAYAESHDGSSPGEQAIAMLLDGDKDVSAAPTMLAEAKPRDMAEKPLAPVRLAAIEQPDAAAKPAALLAEAGITDKPAVASAESALTLMADNMPLREKLNRKNPTNLTSAPHPLMAGGGGFIDMMPPNAANLAAARSENLQLLQGMAAPQTAKTPASAAAVAEAQQGHNPLPKDLVQDMMMQALDKYQAMGHQVSENRGQMTDPN